MVKIVKDGYSSEDKNTSMCYDYLSQEWIVYTRVPNHITKLRNYYPEHVEVLEQLESGAAILVRCKLPKEAISFRKLLSEEQKQKRAEVARERMLKLHRDVGEKMQKAYKKS